MLRIVFGLLLIFAAVAFLLFSIIPAVSDDNQFVLDFFEPIYCETGEQLTSERTVGPTRDGGVGYTAYFTCMRANETTYDATGKAFLVSGGIFTILLLFGIVFIISGSRARVAAQHPSVSYGFGSTQVHQTPGRTVTVTVHNNPASSGHTFNTAPATAPEDIFNLPLEKPVEAPMTVASSGLTASTMFDLQEKLRQLEEAYDHHLINREEYERKRDEILRDFK